ncbi:unnamed protein product [Schistocephalus solidus]|uniref:Uncharacterized protein n=1 Tax=Schistocephalus solidus TaxID=70667 RepID=A0A183SVN9_SCHSO|nr:unnamed protein product [Schistocephalus solidus]
MVQKRLVAVVRLWVQVSELGTQAFVLRVQIDMAVDAGRVRVPRLEEFTCLFGVSHCNNFGSVPIEAMVKLKGVRKDENAAPTWDDAIPVCMLAYRSTVNATTRQTPLILTCGLVIQLPEEIHLPPPRHIENLDTYVSRSRRTLPVAFEKAHLRLQKTYYGRLAHGDTYQAGDIVWIRNFAAPVMVPPTFNPAWVGPYVITRVLSDMTCLIRHQDWPYSEEFSVQFNRLKPGYLAGENTNHSKLQASAFHHEDTQIVEHYLEVSPEGGNTLPEIINDEQQDEKLVELPPEGGSATKLNDAAGDGRLLL